MPLLPNALTLKLIRTIPPPFHRLSKPARKFIHTRDITPSCKNILSDFDLFLLDGKFLLLLLLLLLYFEFLFIFFISLESFKVRALKLDYDRV